MIIKLIKVSLFLLLAATAIGQPLEFEFSTSSMPAPGGVYEVDVRVANFEELLAAQVGIYWDSTVMRIDTLPFVTGDLPDFNRQALSLPEDNQTVVRGKLKLSWSSLSLVPQSLPDGTLLFTMRFDIIGMPCDMTSLTLGDPQPPFLRIEVIHNVKDEIGAIANDFPIMIPGTGCGDPPPPPPTDDCVDGDLALIFPSISVDNGDNVCIPMTVDNFTDVSTFQMSASWDPSVMTYTGVQNFVLPGTSPASFNVNATNGTVTYVWFDNSTVMPQTFADGSTLFELCFDIIGSGSTSTIVAQSTPTVIQASNSDGNILPTCEVGGIITVGGMPPPPGDDFTLVSQSVTATGSTVCVDISTRNFDDIVTAQFAVQWDDAILCYNSLTNLNQTLPLFESLFNQVGDVLRFSWNNPDPVDLPDGTVLFTICYDVKDGNCGAVTPITFIGDPVPIEIAASGPTGDAVIPFDLDQGNVTIDCGTTPVITIVPTITNPLCNGDTNGSISLALSGGTAPYTCAWGAPINVTTTDNSTCIQNNLRAGVTYTGTVSDASGLSQPFSYTLSEPQALVINGGVSGNVINYTISGGTPPYTEQFNPAVPDLNNVSPGTYTLLVTDANSCQQTNVFTVGVVNPVGIRVDGVFSASCGADGSICITCTGGTGTYSLPTATPPLTFDSNQGCFINAEGGTYTLRCTDSNGSSAETTVIVNSVSPTPLNCQVLNVEPAICNGLGGSFEVICSGGCPGYTITVGLAGGAKTLYDPNRTYIPGDYSVCIRDSSGEEQIINFNIPVVGNGTIEVDPVVTMPAMCTSNGVVTTTVTGGCNPTCIIVNNNDPTDTYACSNGAQVSLPAGSYTLSAEDSQGQSASESFIVEIDGPPLVVMQNGGTDAPCSNMNGSVSLNVTGGCGSTTCTIDIGNMNNFQQCDIVGGSISAPAGNHTIAIRDDITGEVVMESVTINVSANAVSPMLTGQTNNSIDITTTGGQSPYAWTWTFPDGVTIVTTEDLSGLTQSGTYSLSVIDNIGCSAALEVILGGPDVFTLNINNNVTASDCGGSTDCNGEITGTVLNGAAPYNITISNQTGDSNTFQIAQDGSFTLPNVCGGNYTISATDSNGSEVELGSTVDVPSPEALIIEEDNVSCSDTGESNGAVSVFVTGGSGGYDYMWTPQLPNAGPSNDNLSPGTYVLVVTDNNGCASSISLVVEDCNGGQDNCGEGVSVMTPNGDGRNDNLIISCADTQNNTIGIYDRYGRKVFSGTNYRNEWNGIDLDGEPLPEGAYHWVYIVDGQITKGTITLLRD